MGISSIMISGAFSVLGWLPLGVIQDGSASINETGFDSKIAHETDGTPVAVYEISERLSFGTNMAIYVSRWDGTQWVRLGSHLDEQRALVSEEPSIAINDDNQIFVAFEQSRFRAGGDKRVFVRTWNGTNWETLGGEILINRDNTSRRPTLTIAGDGNPVVAFTENLDGTNISQVVVMKWDGTNWNQVGDVLSADTNNFLTEGSLTTNVVGRPVLAYREGDDIYVKRWNGREWLQMGSTLLTNPDEFANHPQLSTGTSGRIFASWHERDPGRGGFVVRSAEWRAGSWQNLGGPLNDTEFRAPNGWDGSLTVRGKQVPIIAWMDFDSKDIYVSQYVRSRDTWITLGNRKATKILGFGHQLSFNSGQLQLTYTAPDRTTLLDQR